MKLTHRGNCHQKVVRDRMAVEERDGLFGHWWEDLDTRIENAECRDVSHEQARKVILRYEFLGTYCNAPLFAHGIYFDGHLGGVVVFGAPSPPSLSHSVVGEAFASNVVQLARGACVHWAHPHSASKLIASGLRSAESKGYRVVIAFGDPDAGEIGTVYQATNWLYCGLGAKRPDYFDATGKRVTGPFKKGEVNRYTRAPRTRKHRYVFVLGNRKERRAIRSDLLWKPQPYPKRENADG